MSKRTMKSKGRAAPRLVILALIVLFLWLWLSRLFGPVESSHDGRTSPQPNRTEKTTKTDDGPPVRVVLTSTDGSRWPSPIDRAAAPPPRVDRLSAGECRLIGRVVDDGGKVLAGIPIELLAACDARLDPSLPFDPRLRTATTDHSGRFSFTFRRPRGGSVRVASRVGEVHLLSPTVEIEPFDLVVLDDLDPRDATRPNIDSATIEPGVRLTFVPKPASIGLAESSFTIGGTWPTVTASLGMVTELPRLAGDGWRVLATTNDGRTAVHDIIGAETISLRFDAIPGTPPDVWPPPGPRGRIRTMARHPDRRPIVLALDSKGELDRAWLEALDVRGLQPESVAESEALWSVPPGRYRVDWRRADGDVEIGRVVDVAVGEEVAVPDDLEAKDAVTIVVRDAGGGDVVAGAGVAFGRSLDVVPDDVELDGATTDVQGSVTRFGVPDGEYVVVVSAPGRSKQSRHVTVGRSPAERHFEIGLERGRAMIVSVRTVDGGAAGGWRIAAIDDDGHLSAGEANDAGIVEFKDLAPRRHVVLPLLGESAIPLDSWNWLASESGGRLVDLGAETIETIEIVVPTTMELALDISTIGRPADAPLRIELVHAGESPARGLWPRLVIDDVTSGRLVIDRWVRGRYRAIASSGTEVRIAELVIDAPGATAVPLVFDFGSRGQK